MKPIITILCLIVAFSIYSQDKILTISRFTDLITSKNKKTKQKVAATQLYRNKKIILDKESIRKIFQYITANTPKLSEEEELEILLLSYLCTQTPNLQLVLNEYRTFLIKRTKTSSWRMYSYFKKVMSLYQACLYINDSNHIESYVSLMLDIFKCSDVILLGELKQKSSQDNIDLYFYQKPVEYLELFFDTLNKTKNKELKIKLLDTIYLSPTNITYYIRNKEIEELVTLTSEAEFKDKSELILNKLIQKNDKMSWKNWWDINKTVFTIEKQAMELLKNEETPLKDLMQYSDQIVLSSWYYRSNLPKDYTLRLLEMLDDNLNVINDRKKIYIQTLLLIGKDEHIAQQISPKICKYLASSQLKSLQNSEIFFYIQPATVNNKQIKEELLKILKDSGNTDISRGWATYPLSNVEKNKQEIAYAVLDFFKSTKEPRPKFMAEDCLRSLTGENYGTNIENWKKAIEAMNEKKLKPEKNEMGTEEF